MCPHLPPIPRHKQPARTPRVQVMARPDKRRRPRRRRLASTIFRRALFFLGLTLTLVGCSLITAHVQQVQGANTQADSAARPGPGPVTLEPRKDHTARVSWYSPWRGKSNVSWGLKPLMDESSQSRSTEDQSIHLTGLTPGMRYYVQIETQTSVGVARSSVCSFIAK